MSRITARNVSPIPYSELVSIFERLPSIKAVFIFGSHASDTANPESDLDLGVVADNDPSLEILGKLAALGIEKVDLVLLNGRDYFMEFQATKARKILFTRDNFDPLQFARNASKKWFDYKFYADRNKEALKRRIQDGQN